MSESQVVTFDATNMPVEYSITDKMLAELQEQYGTVPDMTTTEGYELGKLGQARLRELRGQLEEARKDKKAGALEWGRRVDSEAGRIKEALLALETPIKDARKLVDDVKAKAAREKREKEEARVEAIKQKVIDLRALSDLPLDSLAQVIQDNLDTATAMVVDDSFDEFKPAAELEREQAITKLTERLEARVQYDKDQAELKEAREKQAAIEKEQQEKQAAINKENRERQEALDRQAAANKAEADRLAKEEQDRKDAATEKLRKEKEEREAKEAREKKAAERKARKEAQAPDIDKVRKYLAELRALKTPVITEPIPANILDNVIRQMHDSYEGALDLLDELENG